MIVPIAIAVAQAAGVRPLEPVLGATLGASMGFMMPISTPPNAIVYSSGYIPIGQMMRYGILLDVVGLRRDRDAGDAADPDCVLRYRSEDRKRSWHEGHEDHEACRFVRRLWLRARPAAGRTRKFTKEERWRDCC